MAASSGRSAVQERLRQWGTDVDCSLLKCENRKASLEMEFAPPSWQVHYSFNTELRNSSLPEFFPHIGYSFS